MLVTAVARRASVRVQNPIVLDDESEPQRDFALVRRPCRGYPGQHPQPEDILLLIEVSDSSLDTDKGAKLALCAGGRPRILDRGSHDQQRIVHHDPSGESHGTVTSVEGVLDVQALPSIVVPVVSIFA